MTAQPTLAPEDEHAYVHGYVAAILAAATAARLIIPHDVVAVAKQTGTIPALAPLKTICARHNRTVRLHPQFIQAPTVAQCFGHRGIADLIQARPPSDDASRSLIAFAMTADLVIARGGKAGTVLIAERMATPHEAHGSR
jgi:hypothetical protein